MQVKLQQNKKLANIIDIELELGAGGDREKARDLDLELLFYPLNRKITAADFQLYPFEEYAQELNSGGRSTYTIIQKQTGRVFGLLLSVGIMVGFILLKPADIFSIQSVISILGAYTLGKEYWNDLESALIDSTENWRIRYQPAHFHYKLSRNLGLQYFTNLAKELRYQKPTISAAKFDFIDQSNSKVLRAHYTAETLMSLDNKSVHLGSLHFSEELTPKVLESLELLCACKITLTKKITLGIGRHAESVNAFNYRAGKSTPIGVPKEKRRVSYTSLFTRRVRI